MQRRLRHLLADWCLAGLRTPAPSKLRALAAFAERSDEAGRAEGLNRDQARALAATHCFVAKAATVQLDPDLLRDLPALRERVPRIVRAVAEGRARASIRGAGPDRPPRSLRAASALFDAGLFYEAHELLEREWRDAAGDLKIFLQGLIQVAVGCHHQSNGNTRGALRVIAQGHERLRRFRPTAFGIDLEGFCRDVERLLRRLRVAPEGALEAPRFLAGQAAPSERIR